MSSTRDFIWNRRKMMRKTVCETKRLKMVTTLEEDIEFLYPKIFADEVVAEFTFGETISLEEAKAFMKKKFNHDGIFGFSPIIEKSTQELIGYGGILTFKHHNKPNQYEFGYAFAQEVWGLGYATEIALAQIETIKEQFPNADIMATVHPNNGASKRVLEKVGMELMEASVVLGKRGLRDIYGRVGCFPMKTPSKSNRKK